MAISRRVTAELYDQRPLEWTLRVELLCWEKGEKVNMDQKRCRNGDFAKGDS